MAQPEHVVLEPGGDAGLKVVELAGKKVVCPLHNDKVILTRKRRHQRSHFFYRAVLVFASVHEEFRFPTLA